jgi:hypothetical protein
MNTQELMKCIFDNCNGTGKIKCPEYIGEGYVYNDCSRELFALHEDLQRVNREADALIKLNPSCAASYEAQRVSAVAEISNQAHKVAEEG